MFNSSTIISVSIRLNGGMYSENCPLIKACRELHLKMIRWELDLWQDGGGSDEHFIEMFTDVFPPGFIRRDIARAKQIIYDLFDIADSEVLRAELSPIHTYVMYGIITGWYEGWDGINEMTEVPRGIKKYLKQQNASGEEYEEVISWFTDGDACANDFANTYNGDFVSSHLAEVLAAEYLRSDKNAFVLRAMGVDIEDFLDLMPNDLRDLCIKQLSRDQQKTTSKRVSPETQDEGPVVFISYSWDDAQHMQWVADFAEKLTEAGIQTILDQGDLILGDPMPHFMERSIAISDYVLLLCTPEYKRRADKRFGGVGYEASIMAAEINATQNHRKFIPILVSGTWNTSVPIWAAGKFGVDLSNAAFESAAFQKLLEVLLD